MVSLNIKKFFTNARHVLSISYKPTRQEFTKAGKLIIFGILLIGIVGFVLSIIVSLIISGTL